MKFHLHGCSKILLTNHASELKVSKLMWGICKFCSIHIDIFLGVCDYDKKKYTYVMYYAECAKIAISFWQNMHSEISII